MENLKFLSLGIALICIACFLLQLIIPGFTATFMLTPEAPSKLWQYITSIFLHGSVVHLLYNLFALIFFGLLVERFLGSKNFFVLFLVSGIIANIIASFLYPYSLGASGAIMALIGLLAILRPMMTVWAFNLPMPMFVLAIIWLTGSFLGIFGLGDSNTGHLAHLSGLVIGFIYGLFLRFKNKTSQSFKAYQMQRRINLDETSMRNWEDFYLR